MIEKAMKKAAVTVDGNSVHLSMPFAKVDKAKRLVSGYATLDNLDTQGDIVLAEASAKAFERARGNIREMHQPLAVGKMVDFREDEFFHTDPTTGDGKFYRGIFVTAYVSEGAEDTWKKVLDGTLTGFSIGGEINDASTEFVKEAGRTVRFIKDYDLTELSLVDNPANQLANIFSIQKSNGGTFVKGMVAETKIENVFVCNEDDTVIVNSLESADCPQCGGKMENAGWFESGADRAEKAQIIVAKFRAPVTKEDEELLSEGGVDMAKNGETNDKEVSVVNPAEEFPTGEKIEESDETAVPVEAEDVDETEEESDEAEDAEQPEEVVDEATEISKKIDELHSAVKTSLEENKEETLSKVSELETAIAEAKNEFLAKASELESKIDGFGDKIETQKVRLAEFEGRLEKMNSSEAFRKSADLEEESSGKIVQKETSWNGAFSGNRSGFSVDNLM